MSSMNLTDLLGLLLGGAKKMAFLVIGLSIVHMHKNYSVSPCKDRNDGRDSHMVTRNLQKLQIF
mgnify:CR=1 FL=1